MSATPQSSVIEGHTGPSFSGARPGADSIAAFRQILRSDVARDFHDYWLSKCPPSGIPNRSDIRPVEIKQILSSLLIWDYVPEIEANRVRLAGTALTDALPLDPSGFLNTEVLPHDWNEAIRNVGAAFYSEMRPLYFLLSLAPFGRDHVRMEFVSYPLSSGKGEADMGIGVVSRVARAADS